MSACAGTGSRPLTAQDWVQRGIQHFLQADRVVVIPGAGGEASCEEEQPSCEQFTLSQTSSSWGHPEVCASIPTCAKVFFWPQPAKLTFASGGDDDTRVVVSAAAGLCPAWCGWEMDFDRSDGDIVFASTYLKGGSHSGWPTWQLSDYWFKSQERDVEPVTSVTPSPGP